MLDQNLRGMHYNVLSWREYSCLWPYYHIVMKIGCLVLACAVSLLGCKPADRESGQAGLLAMSMIDSVRVDENGFYLNGQGQIKTIGDSIIGVSSIRKPAIGFFDLRSGEQLAQISSSDFPEAPFFPSSFDVRDYPILYVADRYTGSILEFEVQKSRFVRKTKLQLPDDKVVKIALGEFHRTESGFVVELTTNRVDTFDPAFYGSAGDLIYSFDDTGKPVGSFLNYPEVFLMQKGTVSSDAYLESTYADGSLLYSFPQERKLKRVVEGRPYSISEEIPLPASRYFDFNLKSLDRVVSFDDLQNGEQVVLPPNDYFNSMIETENRIYIQTWMIGDESKGLNRTSHLLIYDKSAKKWSETANPRNILDIGMLAGVVNDTLYFYEGSLMQHDEKYIKRAVLRPIEE